MINLLIVISWRSKQRDDVPSDCIADGAISTKENYLPLIKHCVKHKLPFLTAANHS